MNTNLVHLFDNQESNIIDQYECTFSFKDKLLIKVHARIVD